MEKINSLKYVVVQLGSLISTIEKVVDGSSHTASEWENVMTLNSVLKDWVLLQKNIKMQALMPDVLAKFEGYVSEGDYFRVSKMFDSLKPSLSVSLPRVTRLTGEVYPGIKFDPVVLKDNIKVTYEVLKAKAESEQENDVVTDHAIATIEAVYEAVLRMIKHAPV